MRRAVVMGVAGCGKSLVGAALASRLGALWRDGDDLHPAESIAKMARGEPLTDADRAPWLARVGEALRDADGPALIGCSALTRRYRDAIRAAAGGAVAFVHLSGSRELIAGRMAARKGHFMPLSLLDSQFAALEPLAADETGVVVEIDAAPAAVTAAALKGLREGCGWTDAAC
ncbi:gluconokinase [Rubrimonas cliftonensis]|uniref:Gluconokinase n=1 Tax=Rubrimonas cliftonensis TaxID=89524 RepID=A0A1H4F5G3_9RHOB|nr:gluconokinase [Rubrimonas cliftonensis]SEA92048.1 gluconate kinase, SKI family [Rubrimonas cliftonensis]